MRPDHDHDSGHHYDRRLPWMRAQIADGAPTKSADGNHDHDGNERRHRNSCNQRSEEHTSELQSLMRISYAVFCLKKKKKTQHNTNNTTTLKKRTTKNKQ